jgi:hypothetical protein
MKLSFTLSVHTPCNCHQREIIFIFYLVQREKQKGEGKMKFKIQSRYMCDNFVE